MTGRLSSQLSTIQVGRWQSKGGFGSRRRRTCQLLPAHLWQCRHDHQLAVARCASCTSRNTNRCTHEQQVVGIVISRCKEGRTCTSVPITILGLSYGLPSFLRRSWTVQQSPFGMAGIHVVGTTHQWPGKMTCSAVTLPPSITMQQEAQICWGLMANRASAPATAA